MLLLQLISNVTGLSEVNITSLILYGLFALRVIVSADMVALSCTKHVRFSGLLAGEQPATPTPATALSNETLQIILEKLAHLEALEQRLTRQVSVSEQPTPVPQLAAPAGRAERAEVVQEQVPVNGPENGMENREQICDKDSQESHQRPAQPIYTERFASKEQVIAAILQRKPGATPEEIAHEVGCTVRTATKWLQRLQEPGTAAKLGARGDEGTNEA